MPKARSAAELAAGKLISAIQKEWAGDMASPCAEESEAVMNKGHDLLKAAGSDALSHLLASRSVAEYLGPSWLERHSGVKAAVEALERTIVR